MVTLADCQRTQHAWFRAHAAATGGRVFSTHKMDWVWLPQSREMLCMFPTEITEAGLLPVMAEATRRNAATVRIWMNASISAGILPQHRFTRGWQPWWMSAPLEQEPIPSGQDEVAVAGGTDAALDTGLDTHLDMPLDSRVSVTAITDAQLWLATAQIDDQWAGQSYAYLPPDQGAKKLAGIFDMFVVGEHRRTGLGTALLTGLSNAASSAGATHLVLNATPDGQSLYRQCGFELIGKGQTWYFNLPQ